MDSIGVFGQRLEKWRANARGRKHRTSSHGPLLTVMLLSLLIAAPPHYGPQGRCQE